jgi:hypothetical protein
MYRVCDLLGADGALLYMEIVEVGTWGMDLGLRLIHDVMVCVCEGFLVCCLFL